MRMKWVVTKNISILLRLKLLFLFLCFFGKEVNSQPADTLRLEHLYNLEARAVQYYLDHLGQSYAVTANNELIKYNTEGIELFRYADKRYGRLDFVDVSNPMQLLLYYGNFNYVVILERTLTNSGFLSLQELGFPVVQAISMGMDGNIWLYDSFNARLVKVNRKGIRIRESAELTLLLGRRPEIIRLREKGVKVYAIDKENKRLYVFDLMGQWLRERILPQDLTGELIFEDEAIMEISNEGLVFMSLTDPLYYRRAYFPTTFPSFRHVVWRKERIYNVGIDGVISVYEMK